MQNIKKYFMTLALLLTAVTGAWAQTAFGVKEITADMLPASWSTDESAVTADDLAKLGFMEVTKDAAKTWTGAPQEGTVRLVYTLCESVNWVNGKGGSESTYNSRKIFYSCLDGQKIFITTELTEWSLTPDADKKVWTLTNMPANDVELQVEYYAESNLFLSKEALANKANISVLNGSTAVTFGDAGKSTATVLEGNTVTAKFTGTKKVLGMTVAKYVPPVATVTTAPTATAAIIEANSTSALVNAGAANGGTMMYAVTTTNAQPASTADFSATIPTAQDRTAGTYYVWYYAKADAEHSDSEIAGPVSVTLAVMTTVTWNSSNIGGSYPNGLYVSGTYQSYTKEGITLSANADMNDAEWNEYGDESMDGIAFHVNVSGGFTFTAPTGKKFIKIEMTLTGSASWDMASLGTGWAFNADWGKFIFTATWTGSAASTVGLLTGASSFNGEQVKSIVFTLVDAE